MNLSDDPALVEAHRIAKLAPHPSSDEMGYSVSWLAANTLKDGSPTCACEAGDGDPVKYRRTHSKGAEKAEPSFELMALSSMTIRTASEEAPCGAKGGTASTLRKR